MRSLLLPPLVSQCLSVFVPHSATTSILVLLEKLLMLLLEFPMTSGDLLINVSLSNVVRLRLSQFKFLVHTM